MRALIIGGTGLIGRAAAARLAAAGWQVDVTGRNCRHLPAALAAAGVGFIEADRADAGALAAALGGGADLLVDCVCFTAVDAAGLLPLARSASSTVMISSKAVYVDAAGNHANSDERPRFDGPITEHQPTMAPSDIDYNSRQGYGANKVAAEQVLLDSGLPVTVLRPSKVHGAGANPPREWVFVKRVLDRRPAVILARRGTGVDHPSAAANVAELILTAAHRPGRRVLNSADPDAPNGLQICRAIATHLGYEFEEVLLDEPTSADPATAGLGRHPWNAPFPIVLDMSAAASLGYQAAGDYAATVGAGVDWLVSAARGDEGRQVSEWLADSYFDSFFDYAAEDRYLAGSAAAVAGQ
ncbi:MAG TPA: NAD-dependent epimerase/dehydratase family protein [Streptosporangiaceae bacterium]